MAHLALALLGSFQATLDGRPVEGLNSVTCAPCWPTWPSSSGREHPREQVAALLWPERPDREALSALRFALSNLHRALGTARRPPPFCSSPAPMCSSTPPATTGWMWPSSRT